MPKRSFAMALAMALFASLASSAPSKAATYVTTLTAVNLVKPADDFEAIFSGTAGTVAKVNVVYTAATVAAGSPTVIMGGTGIEIDFSKQLLYGGSLVVTFQTNFKPTGITSAMWTFKSAAPVSAQPYVNIQTAAVPEPASMALLGIGMAGFLSFRRFFKRKAMI